MRYADFKNRLEALQDEASKIAADLRGVQQQTADCLEATEHVVAWAHRIQAVKEEIETGMNEHVQKYSELLARLRQHKPPTDAADWWKDES